MHSQVQGDRQLSAYVRLVFIIAALVVTTEPTNASSPALELARDVWVRLLLSLWFFGRGEPQSRICPFCYVRKPNRPGFTGLHQAGEDRVVTRANLSADCPATGLV